MSSKFESSVKEIQYSQEKVYNTLSNLSNLERIKDKIPQDKVEDFTFDNDSVSINAGAIGRVTLRIIEREEPKCIKFEGAESPLPFNFWIQILPISDTNCKIKLTLKAEISIFLKSMVKKSLTEGIEKMADLLQNISYD